MATTKLNGLSALSRIICYFLNCQPIIHNAVSSERFNPECLPTTEKRGRGEIIEKGNSLSSVGELVQYEKSINL